MRADLLHMHNTKHQGIYIVTVRHPLWGEYIQCLTELTFWLLSELSYEAFLNLRDNHKMGRLNRGIASRVVLPAVIETVAIILLFPKHLPHNPLVWTLSWTLAFQVGLNIFYLTMIWPYFITPLRHLPHPTVRKNYIKKHSKTAY
jgi:hypothetical protein